MSAINRLVLMGMKGCGKTTLGKMLADSWSGRFVDTDSLLEELYKKQTGTALAFREIFATRGAEFFCDLEQRAITQFADSIKSSDQGVVVSLGGRSAMNPNLTDVIRSIGKIIYIRVDVDELFERVSAGGLPAFLHDSDNPLQKFAEIFENRREIYENLADGIIDTTGCDIPETMEKLIQAVNQLGDNNVG